MIYNHRFLRLFLKSSNRNENRKVLDWGYGFGVALYHMSFSCSASERHIRNALQHVPYQSAVLAVRTIIVTLTVQERTKVQFL